MGFIDLRYFLFVGCETGWLEFKGHCYIEGQSLATWNDANVKYNIANCKLAFIRVDFILRFISGKLVWDD